MKNLTIKEEYEDLNQRKRVKSRLKNGIEIIEYLQGSLGIALVRYRVTATGEVKTMTVQAFKKKYESDSTA